MINVDKEQVSELGVPYEDESAEALFQGPRGEVLTLFRDAKDPRSCCLYLGDNRECGEDVVVEERKSGSNHPQWTGGVVFRGKQTYVKVYEHHPKRDGRGYVMEKVIVMEQVLGRIMWSFERVYHRDLSKTWDNTPANIGLKYVFPGERRTWYVDQNGNYLRWGSVNPYITTQDGRQVIIEKEFTMKVHTKSTAPKKAWRVYDRHYCRAEDSDRIFFYVAATCPLCGKPKWQNVTVNQNILDYARVCESCDRDMRNKFMPLPKTEYWMENGKACLITFRRGGHNCFLADMRKDWIRGELQKVLQHMDEVQFWSIPVDKPTEQCIVKEECR